MKRNDCLPNDTVQLTDEMVVDYLLQNPDFFIRNVKDVENMVVPHSVHDSVSLVEWLMERQRVRISALEEEIVSLMGQAAANEKLFQELLNLYVSLLQAKNLEQVLVIMNQWSRKMGLADATIRLFSEQWQLEPSSTYAQLALSRQQFEPIRIQRMANNNQYLGRLNEAEKSLLLPNSQHVGSVAISLLGQYGELGMIIFNSHSAQHYYAGMGTSLLEQLSQLLPKVMMQWIKRA